jgi:DNA mismatch repair protein MutH
MESGEVPDNRARQEQDESAKALARKTRAAPPRGGLSRPCWNPDEPGSEAELLRRARALAGHTLAELAARAGVVIASEAARAKGLAGGLVERALGARARGNEPDFARIGVELKTIPLTALGRPRESTFVCCASLVRIAEMEWERSGVCRKLARVLWVPIEADPRLPLPVRRVGVARLWSPTAEQQAALREDWEHLAGLIGRGDAESVDARMGRHLQLRPKARNASVLARGVDERGAPMRIPPRAFYLRASFTASIFAAGLTCSDRAQDLL